MSNSEQESMATAKQEVFRATDHVVEVVKLRTGAAINDLTLQLKSSTHEITDSILEDVQRVSEAVVTGMRQLKTELKPPRVIREHPFASISGGLALGAAGVWLARRITHPARPVAHVAAAGGLGGRLAVAALEIGLSLWLARRSRQTALIRSDVTGNGSTASGGAQSLH